LAKMSVLDPCEMSEEISRDIPVRKRKNIPASIKSPNRIGCFWRNEPMVYNQQPASS
jgi:hypothetical protein